MHRVLHRHVCADFITQIFKTIDCIYRLIKVMISKFQCQKECALHLWCDVCVSHCNAKIVNSTKCSIYIKKNEWIENKSLCIVFVLTLIPHTCDEITFFSRFSIEIYIFDVTINESCIPSRTQYECGMFRCLEHIRTLVLLSFSNTYHIRIHNIRMIRHINKETNI